MIMADAIATVKIQDIVVYLYDIYGWASGAEVSPFRSNDCNVSVLIASSSVCAFSQATARILGFFGERS